MAESSRHPSSEAQAAFRVYDSQANHALLDLINDDCGSVLDVGCGTGQNAASLLARQPSCKVFGITRSPEEAQAARRHMARCWVSDIELTPPSSLEEHCFDALVFSHVLEHVRQPDVVLRKFVRYLRIGGQVLIAVPNILSWRMRIQLLLGHFEYQSEGPLDDTHLRFFTYLTADQYLLAESGLVLRAKSATGGLPFGRIRERILPRKLMTRLDEWACKRRPNLFGDQVLISAEKAKGSCLPPKASSDR